MITPVEFKVLLPLACAWAEEQEAAILREGVPLSERMLAIAKEIGVAHPERVRLRVVEEVPAPANPALQAAAEATGLLTALTAGLTLRYGIFIRADCWGDRRLVAHELVHTMQYERLGGFKLFLERYLHECLTFGYPNGELEQEAIRLEQKYKD